MSDPTVAYFQENPGNQPGVRDIVRYDAKSSTIRTDRIDVIICAFDGKSYHPITSCLVTFLGSTFDVSFSSQHDPIARPKTLEEKHAAEVGISLIRKFIVSYLANVKDQLN